MNNFSICLILAFIFLFNTQKSFAQSNGLVASEVIYKTIEPPRKKFAPPPPARLYKVQFNKEFVREEFISEPSKFAITDLAVMKKKFSKEYYGLDMVIEEDVKPRNFKSVISEKTKTIAGYTCNLAIVFVNNKWQDVYFTKEIPISYPAIYGVPGMALEYTVPGENGTITYQAQKIESKPLNTNTFTFPSDNQNVAQTDNDINLLRQQLKKEREKRILTEKKYALAKKELALAEKSLTIIGSDRTKAQDDARKAQYDKAVLEAKLANAKLTEKKTLTALDNAKKEVETTKKLNKTLAEESSKYKKQLSVQNSAKQQNNTTAQKTKKIKSKPQPTIKKLKHVQKSKTKQKETKTIGEEISNSEVVHINPESIKKNKASSSKSIDKLQGKTSDVNPSIHNKKASPLNEKTLTKKADKEALILAKKNRELEKTRIAQEKANKEALLLADKNKELDKIRIAQEKAEEEALLLAQQNKELEKIRVAQEKAEKLIIEIERQAVLKKAKEEDGYVSLMDFAKKERTADVAKKSDSNVGNIAPDFEGLFEDKTAFRLSDYRGKVVVINFWFVACKPCITEIPKLNALTIKYAGKDVVFLALCLDDAQKIKNFRNNYNFKYQLVPKARGIAKKYNIGTYPTHMVLDKNGKILVSQNGFTDLVENDIIDAINNGLGQ